MDPATIMLNLAYAVYLASSMFRTLVRVRIMLIATSIAFIVFGIIDRSVSIIVWNALFGLLHGLQLARYLHERRQVQLSDDDERFRKLLFPELDLFDFHTLWAMGEETEYSDATLVEGGQHQPSVMLVLDGEVAVFKAGERISILGPGALVGEMSYLSGEVASATVRAEGLVRVREWDPARLSTLESLNPAASKALRGLIGTGLAAKLR